jgi:parallel beta-helix repeat protein
MVFKAHKVGVIQSMKSNISLFCHNFLKKCLLFSFFLWTISPALQAATITVSPGDNLQSVLNSSKNGDIITVLGGTYTVLTGEPYFHIDQSITLQASGTVVLQASGTAYFGLAVRAGGVILQGLTINGGQMGIGVMGTGGAALSNVRLTSLTVNATNSPGHGIYFSNVSSSTIDGCTVVSAYSNGIFLDLNSHNNLVMNNLVQKTVTQHAFALKNSNGNTLVNNTIAGSAFHGIELNGSSYSRVEKNSISGHQYDGIVVTRGDTLVSGETALRQSLSNYIAKNLIVSNGLSAGRTSGTGIWLNETSDGTFIFGNDVSGVVEAGITSFNSSKSYLKGNRVHGNGQAGLLWWNVDSTFPRPSHTVIHNNFIHDNPQNANILIRGAWYNDIAYNFISGSNISSPKLDGGFSLRGYTPSSSQQSGGSPGY